MEIDSKKYISEILSNKELRKKELEQIWKGFKTYRKHHQNFEKKMAGKIRKAFETSYEGKMEKEDMSAAREVGMLFYYGAHLAKEMFPRITSEISIPSFSVREQFPIFSNMYALYRFDDHVEVGESRFILSIDALLEAYWPSFSTHKWVGEEEDLEISQYLENHVIVQSLLGGVEEYAHEVFNRLKDGKYLKKDHKRDDELREKYLEFWEQKDWPNYDLTYHLQNSERRALLWKLKFLNKHLPSWAYPTHEFNNRLSNLRQAETK